MVKLSDTFQRKINYLRVSVTDRCNLRCIYCMPPDGIELMEHDNILSYEEIFNIISAAADLGITKIRLTGGEPLSRLVLPELVRMIKQIKTIDDIALTTNGLLLGRYAAELKEAGLNRVNISLDTLKQDKFEHITRRSGKLSEVLSNIEMARNIGLNPVKINVVVVAGVNDDEILDFAGKTISDGWHVRFIELMLPVGVSTNSNQFISAKEIKKRLNPLGKMESYRGDITGNGPAKYFRFPHSEGSVGFITPVSEHFCHQCNRLRLTSDGILRPCLLSEDEIDLKTPLRNGSSAEELRNLIKKAVTIKPLSHHIDKGYMPQDRPFSQVGG
ncbi:GTP 3',8-cyclase MoaA [Chloroflexota bacterium]